jgi:putative phage-type endonuclease
MEQGSPEWLAVKAGKISGSRFAACMALNKRNGQPNKPRRDLVADLIRERQTGVLTSIEPNEYMQHGTRCEPIACALYEFVHDVTVEHAAWIPHPELDYIGFSPDGLLGDDGMVEFKCPFVEARHTRTVDSGKCPDDYYPQVQGGLWVTGRQWAHFASFWEPAHDLCVVRVDRDDEFIYRLAAECAAVWSEVLNAQEEAA